MEDLITKNEKLVSYVLGKMGIVYEHKNYQDLKQAGYLGLVKASETYNKSKGAFSTHAYFYVRKEIQNALPCYNMGITFGDSYRTEIVNRSKKQYNVYSMDNKIKLQDDKETDYHGVLADEKTPTIEKQERIKIAKEFFTKLCPCFELLEWVFSKENNQTISKTKAMELARQYYPSIHNKYRETKAVIKKMLRDKAMKLSLSDKDILESFSDFSFLRLTKYDKQNIIYERKRRRRT